ncbi:MAG: aminoglycoside phosphotransferase family protein [Nitrospiraceae bacterium]|nr:aminoglycoside phosphotransferase family protein [Nitrospiraceae bacterium]
MSSPLIAAGQFTKSRITGVAEFGDGNINNTFLVESEDGKFVLQRINSSVFRRPEDVMRNIRICTEHIRQRTEGLKNEGGRRWAVPSVIPARSGLDHWTGPDGSFWRALSLIEGAESFSVINNTEHAREAGYALGLFHSFLSDLPPERLADTLPGFHITPGYLARYDAAVAQNSGRCASPEGAYCLDFIEGRKGFLARVLEDARGQGRLLVRIIHGDPKINNILMDTSTGQAVSMIDLDTVKPGLIHYDIGDCLRSGCNPLGEETEAWEDVNFDLGLCRAMLGGYLRAARQFLTVNDLEFIYDCVRLMAFELGVRFFTDHLEGDTYFKVRFPGHNLRRALVQLKLTESIELQEAAIRAAVMEYR